MKVTLLAVTTLAFACFWSGESAKDCLSRAGERCLPKSEVYEKHRRYFNVDGSPCWTHRNAPRNPLCIVKQGRNKVTFGKCSCKPQCGCLQLQPICDGRGIRLRRMKKKCNKKVYTPEHTMCKYVRMGRCGTVCVRGFTTEEKAQIVKLHNDLRRKVAKGLETRGFGGIPQPSAPNMNELVWSDEVAEVAQRWADQCTWGHDIKRRIPKFKHVGQNIAGCSSRAFNPKKRLEYFVNLWYDEVDNYNASAIGNFSMKTPPNHGTVGHYTAMVWPSTKELGCGFIQYQPTRKTSQKGPSRYREFLVCNYGPCGNIRGYPMYEKGPAGSKCAKNAKNNNGLCSNA